MPRHEFDIRDIYDLTFLKMKQILNYEISRKLGVLGFWGFGVLGLGFRV